MNCFRLLRLLLYIVVVLFQVRFGSAFAASDMHTHLDCDLTLKLHYYSSHYIRALTLPMHIRRQERVYKHLLNKRKQHQLQLY